MVREKENWKGRQIEIVNRKLKESSRRKTLEERHGREKDHQEKKRGGGLPRRRSVQDKT